MMGVDDAMSFLIAQITQSKTQLLQFAATDSLVMACTVDELAQDLLSRPET
jgi:hypothetical protein